MHDCNNENINHLFMGDLDVYNRERKKRAFKKVEQN